MSEVLEPQAYGFEEFQGDVVSTRRGENPVNWKDGYFDLILDEWGELVGQHGNTMSLFLPHVNKNEELEANPGMLDGVKEELGDLLWFDVSAAALLGKDAKGLCAEALKAHTGTTAEIESLDVLQKVVRANAHKIEVLTKGGMYWPDQPRVMRFTSLFDSPFYHFNRTTARVTRALTDGRYDHPIRSASSMEPISRLDAAIGEHMNVIAYMAYLAGLSLSEIAQFNIKKNRQRLADGYSK